MSDLTRLLRVVIDTNLFVSALIRADGFPDRVVRAWREGRFHLVTTPQLNTEIAGVLARRWLTERYRIDTGQRQGILRDLDAVEPVQPLMSLPLQSRDLEDNKVLAAALGGRADYLVTGDNDLLSLGGDLALGALRIVTPAEFMERLAAEESADREPGD